MIPYMTTHSVASFDHDTSNDNDTILGLVPNLCTQAHIDIYIYISTYNIYVCYPEKECYNGEASWWLSYFTLWKYPSLQPKHSQNEVSILTAFEDCHLKYVDRIRSLYIGLGHHCQKCQLWSFPVNNLKHDGGSRAGITYVILKGSIHGFVWGVCFLRNFKCIRCH